MEWAIMFPGRLTIFYERFGEYVDKKYRTGDPSRLATYLVHRVAGLIDHDFG